jgi:hypothetical protein
MSYQFFPDQSYRMPTHFGPSLGPRQGVEGRRYANMDFPLCKIVSATFQADKEQLEKLLPPGFTLREPYTITFSLDYMTQIEWLAGRGYNTFGVSIPVTYNGQQERVEGRLLLVLWENKADPILTGREDLGFAKLYCEIPEPQYVGNDMICRASWDGFEFFTMTLSQLKPVSLESLPATEPSAGMLHYKYIPKTGVPGEADAAYATLTPAGDGNGKVISTYSAETAALHFNRATWEQLPTLVQIVNTLSELRIGECIRTAVLNTQGGRDLSDQRILR